MRTCLAFCAPMYLAACAPEDPSEIPSQWEITVSMESDTCNQKPVEYEKDFLYDIYFDGSNVALEIDDQAFATGTITGCRIDYQSPLWGEQRNGLWVRWQLTGEANWRQGGDACDLPEDLDWQGTETFDILESEVPEIPVGCNYVTSVIGRYVQP